MPYSIFIDGTDQSNYIVDIGSVPHIKRDKVLQPLTGGFNMSVSEAITPIIDDVILVKEDSNIRFSGYISSLERNYANHTYDLEVTSALQLLNNYKVDYNTLHSALFTGETNNEAKLSDNEGYPNVALIWLLKKMFTIAGLTLITTSVEDRVVSTSYGGTTHEHDLVVDENMLYAINQDVAGNHVVLDATPTSGQDIFGDKKITFLDFFQRICIGREYYVQPTTTALQFKLFLRVAYSSANNYTVADNNKYDYRLVSPLAGTTSNYYKLDYGSDAVGGKVTTVRGLYAGVDFANTDVNTSTNYITSTAHGLKDDSMIKFTSSTTLPSPLLSTTTYYIVGAGVDSFQVSTTVGGTAITITSVGSGTHTYYGTYDVKNAERQGFGKFGVPFWNNFWIKFHIHDTTVGSVYSTQALTTSLMAGGYANYYHFIEQAREEIITTSLDYSKYRMLEHWVNPKEQTHKILQPLN